jgi:hypothetical protein
VSEKQESTEERKDKRDCHMCENYMTELCTYKDEPEKRHVCHKFGWKS